MASVEEEEFYRSARAWGWVEARKVGLTHDQAADCSQYFVLKWLLKPLDPPRWTWPQEQIDAFLNIAARNHAINFLHSVQAEAAWFVRETDDESIHCYAWGRTARAQPEPWLMQRLFWEQIHSALQRLPPRQSTLLIRFHIGGATIAELAACGGRDEAIRQRLVTARKRLRAVLIARSNTELELRSYLTPPPQSPCRMTGRVNRDKDDVPEPIITA